MHTLRSSAEWPFASVEEAQDFLKTYFRCNHDGRAFDMSSPVLLVRCFDRKILEDMGLVWAMLSHKRLGSSSPGGGLIPELLETSFRLASAHSLNNWISREKQAILTHILSICRQSQHKANSHTTSREKQAIVAHVSTIASERKHHNSDTFNHPCRLTSSARQSGASRNTAPTTASGPIL